MISKFFTARRGSQSSSKPSIPAGERVYAVGDIHGRLDLLDDLIAKIVADHQARDDSVSTSIIFLGDLVDRGPESAGVVERLRQLAIDNPAPITRFLLGNHEEVFLATLAGDLNALKFFHRIGGRETILSYGISEEEHRDLDYPELLTRTIAMVPPEHVEFLRSFEDLIIVGDYAFVHAGVRPQVELARQKPKDLRWIRDEFLDHDGVLEKVVVHGHTIRDEVVVQQHRIGLDTGAFATGRLTAMGFEGSERWIIQAEGDPGSDRYR